MRAWVLTYVALLLVSGNTLSSKVITPNVMAPLTIGDIRDPNNPLEEDAWRRFEAALDEAQRLGVYAVTTDVWWGVVQPKPTSFRWDYYDKIATLLRKKKLKWIPIVSLHQCGGNVGDTCYIPLPSWVWTAHIGEKGITDEHSLKYVSEYGHTSNEVVSVWGTSYVLKDYEAFFREFQEHFKSEADNIAEINISLGSSGELRYPSFNAHDPKAGYPSRGALQSYSGLALDHFRASMKRKYKTLSALKLAWGYDLKSWSEVYPPSDLGPPNASDGFFHRREHFSEYGKDFFDWYQDSLLEHGKAVLNKAIDVLNAPGAAFRGIEIGAKIPGIHWRSRTDRVAELAGGMLRTSDTGWDDDKAGHGYATIIGLFKDIGNRVDSPNLQLHYTCLEKSNGEDGAWAASLAKDLVFWVGAEAKRQRVSIKGENALAGALAADSAWNNIEDALTWSSYSGITILRLEQVASAGVANRRFKSLISSFGKP